MRLKTLAAQIILIAFFGGSIAIRLAKHGTWLYTYAPLGMFLVLALGALIGIAGMIQSRIERHRSRSRKSQAT